MKFFQFIIHVISGFIFILPVYIIAHNNNYNLIEAAILYLQVSFIVAFIFSLFIYNALILFTLSIKHRVIFIFVVILLLSIIIHPWYFHNYGIGGEYYLPSNIHIESKSNQELSKLILHKNVAIRSAVVNEFQKRGQETNDIMIQVLNDNKQFFWDDKYYNNYHLIDIVELLSKRKDKRVIPFLNYMLKTNSAAIINENIKYYGNRYIANKYLFEYFNIKTNAIIEEPILKTNNSSSK